MPQDSLANILKKRRQISISVIGRRTGRTITVPVWFVHDANAVWLLPVNGSKTQWYRNLQANRSIAIQAGNERRDLRGRLIKSPPAVRKVIQAFRDKYTAAEIKRWYTRLDVAVQVPAAIGAN